jgi:cell division protease FtsH
MDSREAPDKKKTAEQTLKEKLKSPQWRAGIASLLIFIVVIVWAQYMGTGGPVVHKITYTQFLKQLDSGNVRSVSIKHLRVMGELKNKIDIVPEDGEKASDVKQFQTFLPTFQGEELISRLREHDVVIDIEPEEGRSLFLQFIVGLLPWVLIIGVWVFIMRRAQQQMQGGPGGLFSFGQSKAKLYDVTKPSVTFESVAGLKNVKNQLKETIEFLKDPAKFTRLGAKVPKGVLLIGPPGTGKTLLARATAGEAHVPFYSISGSEFIEMFVGVGASRVRDLFKKARDSHPSIIFIDEIDAVGRTRGAGLGGGHDEREQTLNQLLSEMDGFDPNEEVIIMAATNRPDVLDPALLRPGRFDRRIVIDSPGWRERKEILEVHTRNKKIADDLDLEKIARGTPGMTGADLENLANEASLTAVRKEKDEIDMSDFDEARDIILMGAVREETISEVEKKITAYHEAGHALVAWKLPGTDPIYKVSILPRGLAMGVTQLLPEEDRHYYPKTYLMNRLSVALGGRNAERIVFNDVSSGSQSDLKEATSLAEKMVAQWGMSDKVGPVNLGRGEEHPFLGRELAQPKRYSEEMAWIMDREIQNIILEAEEKAKEILTKNRESLDKLAEALVKEEVLEKDDLIRLIGEPEKKEDAADIPSLRQREE